MLYYSLYYPPPLFVESRGRGDRGETSALSLTLPSLVCVALVRQLPTLARYPEVQSCLSPVGGAGGGLSKAWRVEAHLSLLGPVPWLSTLFETSWQLLWSLPACVGPRGEVCLSTSDHWCHTQVPKVWSQLPFIKAYREECTCLRLHLQLVRGILTWIYLGFRRFHVRRGWKTQARTESHVFLSVPAQNLGFLGQHVHDVYL